MDALETDQNVVVTNEPEVEEGVHNYSAESEWVKPTDPLILERIEWFKDQKIGLMMHWGPYSQLGLVESWALSDADGDWSRGGVDWTEDMEHFKREYVDLNKTFNPIRVQPELWADLAAEGGFKYLTFTTKHHDGFCMWDTRTTDYRITGSETPFHMHRYADLCKHIFDAFRSRGLAISAYFSKADWNTPYYWAPGMERGQHMWRGPSYDPTKYPWLWEKFIKFTHDQIEELLTRYGRIDMLWLDAGWVRGGERKQDIRLGEIVDRMREHQPWLLAVDRTVGGPYENVVTPEQTIPKRAMHIPWESCITMGTSFSFKYEDTYKSGREIVHMLLEIVAKGGNLALNVGPQPDGRLPEGAIRGMKELGAWLAQYGEAVYGTRIVDPYFQDGYAFTRKGDNVFCFKLYKTADSAMKQELHIPYQGPIKGVQWYDDGSALEYSRMDAGVKVVLPEQALQGAAPIAHVIRLVTA
ncbi:alpha-L-fucosidase [Paenibacillus guangzhouensis]|uniref:alpha-L-fucosidase n=1 Tax=Paenibacillus guangzhouensis TaxID=1473112 RepID=UPI001266F57D|nr:alpha-L-fucosidase [Paenibacillus guangzhouensis]